MSSARTARIERETSESKVVVEVNLDGTGRVDVATGVGFYDHMLTAFGRHSLVDLTVHSEGDVHIDAHHTVEDTAIVLGEAIREALEPRIELRERSCLVDRGCQAVAGAVLIRRERLVERRRAAGDRLTVLGRVQLRSDLRRLAGTELRDRNVRGFVLGDVQAQGLLVTYDIEIRPAETPADDEPPSPDLRGPAEPA